MKKTLLSIIAAFALCLTANAQTDWGTNWSNVFKGQLWVALADEVYDDETLTPDSVEITLNSAGEINKIDLTLANFSFMGIPLGDIFLSKIGVVPNAQGFTFMENPDTCLIFGDDPEGQIIADVHLDHNRSYITTLADGDSLVAYIPVVWKQDDNPNHNVPIYVLFKGKATITTNIKPLLITTFNKVKGIYDISGRRHNQLNGRHSDVLIIDGVKTIRK